MTPLHRLCSTACLVLGLWTPVPTQGQAWDLDVSFQQSFTPMDILDSPRGYHMGVAGHRLLGPVGLELSFERVSQGSVDTDGFCGAFSCVTGPVDQDASLATLRLALLVATDPNHPVQAGLGVSGLLASFNRSQSQRDPRREVDSSSATNFGLGLTGELRLPRFLRSFRPRIYAQLERIGSEECLADASCFFSEARTVKAVGVGIAWRFRQ